ncbi:MAG: hypothetical protein KI791_03030 [Cyclobacteriaceae bacterium]|nr:hypothetical protein [Cyclobacteriaceae bacterium SS2]
MNRFNPRISVITLVLALVFYSCKQPANPTIEIRGIYGNPKPFWDKDIKLPELGVNSIFVHSGSIDSSLMERAEKEGIAVYAEFATLNGKNYVDKHPEAWPINELGEREPAASWFMGVCPTEPGFRQYRYDLLRTLLSKYDVKGIWMDYVHWHAQFEEPEPILPETCFCDHCLNTFSDASDLVIPDGDTKEKAKWILENHDPAWRKWRSEVIYDWVIDIREIIDGFDPDILLGVYHCPWNDTEFDSARYRILGLDYELLKKSVDVFSPMVYHERMGRSPEWVAENIHWFNSKLDIKGNEYPKVWPIVQAYNNPGVVSAKDFETVMLGGLSTGSTGIMMFTTYAVAEDEEKTATMKKIYMDLINQSAK